MTLSLSLSLSRVCVPGGASVSIDASPETRGGNLLTRISHPATPARACNDEDIRPPPRPRGVDACHRAHAGELRRADRRQIGDPAASAARIDAFGARGGTGTCATHQAPTLRAVHDAKPRRAPPTGAPTDARVTPTPSPRPATKRRSSSSSSRPGAATARSSSPPRTSARPRPESPPLRRMYQ